MTVYILFVSCWGGIVTAAIVVSEWLSFRLKKCRTRLAELHRANKRLDAEVSLLNRKLNLAHAEISRIYASAGSEVAIAYRAAERKETYDE